MGQEIIKVPVGFEHPRDEEGELIEGAHLEPLWDIREEEKTCYQIYENVSEGSPVSPVFSSQEEMVDWLIKQGNSEQLVKQFVALGHIPSLIIASDYN